MGGWLDDTGGRKCAIIVAGDHGNEVNSTNGFDDHKSAQATLVDRGVIIIREIPLIS